MGSKTIKTCKNVFSNVWIGMVRKDPDTSQHQSQGLVLAQCLHLQTNNEPCDFLPLKPLTHQHDGRPLAEKAVGLISQLPEVQKVP